MHEKIAKIKDLKLLFVEDEKDLLKIIIDTLNKLQANFLVARDGKEAFELLKNTDDIDLVITDINMPNMNGLELIELSKNSGNNTPFIVMSAHTEKEYIEKAKSLGIKDYLLKPFDFIKFIELVSEMDLKK